MTIGIYITYRILDVADLTVEGSITMGAAVCAVSITAGIDPYLSLLLAFAAGMAAGLCVAVMLLCYYSATLADYIASTAFNVVALAVLSILLAVVVRWLTKSDYAGIATALLCLAALVALWLISPDTLETLLPDLMSELSLFERFYTFVNGVFDVTAIVYYASVTVFFLFLCVQSLEKKRYNG